MPALSVKLRVLLTAGSIGPFAAHGVRLELRPYFEGERRERGKLGGEDQCRVLDGGARVLDPGRGVTSTLLKPPKSLALEAKTTTVCAANEPTRAPTLKAMFERVRRCSARVAEARVPVRLVKLLCSFSILSRALARLSPVGYRCRYPTKPHDTRYRTHTPKRRR